MHEMNVHNLLCKFCASRSSKILQAVRKTQEIRTPNDLRGLRLLPQSQKLTDMCLPAGLGRLGGPYYRHLRPEPRISQESPLDTAEVSRTR